MDPAERSRQKRGAARISILFAGTVALVKLVAGILTNSVSLYASFADSFVDLLASAINYVSIAAAEKPADADHAYGHGKAESLAGLTQAILILGSGLVLAGISIGRLIHGAELREIDLGLGIMIATTIGSLLLTWRLRVVARRTESVALQADSMHYATDVVTNGGALLALAIYRWTGQGAWDPAISLVLALYLGGSAWGVLRRSVDVLMDRELPDDVRERIIEIVRSRGPDVVGCHDFRTRDSGTVKFIEFHLEIRNDVTFERAHALTEEVIAAVRAAVPDSEVTVHSDPADNPADPPRKPVGERTP